MSYPDYCSKYFRRLHSRQLIPLVLGLALLAAACGGTVVSKTEGKKEPTKPVSPSLHFWLGNSQRNSYGSGPWSDGPLENVWS